MKNKITFLLTALFLLTITPHAEAKQYCGEAVLFKYQHNASQTKTGNLTCEKISDTQYKVTVELTDGSTFHISSYNGNSISGNFNPSTPYNQVSVPVVISNSNKTLTATFNYQPTFQTSSPQILLKIVNQYSGADNYLMPTDIEWGTCGPKDTEKPVISSVSASNIGNTSATINVVATDNTGITKVVIKNGANELVNQTITATKNLNGSYSVTGLTKNTSYTLTVTVFDAAGNTSDAKTVTFTTTNTKEPTINSAAHASSTATQIILNVTATDANKYKVVERNDLFSDKILEVSSGTATSGQITITGLSGSTTYNLRVYAMWDGTMSTNYKELTVTTPLGSQCSGTRGPASGSGTALKYEIMFDGTDVNITLQSANSDDPLETCIVESYINKGSSATQFANVTAVNGVAVATFNRPLGEIEYIRFQYKTRNMSSATSTANGNHEPEKLVYYVVGDCQPDPDVPYMKSVTKAGATTTSITLNVEAIVNGGANTVTQYKVSIGGAAATTYTATNGQITINGLTHSTSYDFEVWAFYNGNQSENSKTVTASTNKESECEGTRGHFTDATWDKINYKIEYDEGEKELKVIVTCSTKTLTTLQIQWDIPGIKSSAGMENFTNGVYTTEVTNDMIGNPMLIRIQYGYSGKAGLSVTADGLGENSTGIIYYVVGECGTADTQVPIATSATAENVGNTTADIRVVASDDTGITRVEIKDGSTPVLEKNIDATRQLDQAFTVTGLTRNTTYSNFSVTVYDRENKNATVTVPPFTTTDTPEPEILSASVVGELISASTAIVAVTSTQANQYKVVDVSGKIADQILKVTSGTAADGKITIQGLKRLSTYTFHVYAMYNNTVSQNYKEITFSTPNGSECSGTRGHYNGEAVSPVNFEIDYIPSNRQLQVRLTCEKELTVRMINWTCNGTTYGMNGTHFDGDTYTYTLPEEMVGKEMYIRFEYSYSGINGNRLTAENLAANDPNIIYYKVGECGCKPDDGDNPTMGAVSIASVNTTSVTLNVEGTDPSSTVSSFVVVAKDGNVADGATYYATNRKITIAGLASCQTYQWDIYAKDASCNTSENKESITVTTAAENYALNKDASFVYNENPGYTGAQVVDGNLTTRGGTQKTDLKDIEQVLPNSVFTVDLGEVKIVNEIDIYWERAASTDYELQASIDNTNWSTIARYTSTPKWVIYTEIPKQGEDNMIYRFHNMPARYLRVVPHTLSVADAWGMSIWEFEVYGECNAEIENCPIVLGVRAESIKAQSAVISVSAIDQQTPNHADLTYIVTTEFTNAAGRTMINTYTFDPGASGRVNTETTVELTLDGLVPGANYTIIVEAKDPSGTTSCNFNSINIRTGKAEGCGLILEGNDAIETDDWLPFPSGMTYNVKLLNSDANTFDADISFINTPAGTTINKVYLSVQKQYTQSDCYGGWIDKEMALQDGKYTLELKKDDVYVRKGQDGCSETLTQDYEKPLFPEWPNLELAFMVETNQGIFHTNVINYNAEMVNPADCEDYFIIFHKDSEPEEDMKTQYAGGTIDKPIYYYRYVTPDQWTPLCLPFAVTAVQVYDPADKAYYNLTAKTKSAEGSFWMREQVEGVSGEDFKGSWYDGVNTLPQPNTAYNFRVPSNYYENKYIIFKGNATEPIATDFELGARPAQDDQYTLYGNNTLMPQTMVQAYKEDDDGKYYRLQENWTLNPFECYVLASTETMKRMPIIGRWRSDNEATSIDEINAEMPLDEIHVYTTLGQHVTTLYQCSLRDAELQIAQTMTAGCYIIVGPQVFTKLLIP